MRRLWGAILKLRHALWSGFCETSFQQWKEVIFMTQSDRDRDQQQPLQAQPKQGQTNANQAQQNQAQPNQTPSSQAPQNANQSQRDSGMPGGGAGRREDPGRTGVYPLSASQGADNDAPVVSEGAFGQGDRGTQGAQDSGDSETMIMPPDGEDDGEPRAES
jgi:hypothetical protein